jgi:hypothetical protein
MLIRILLNLDVNGEAAKAETHGDWPLSVNGAVAGLNLAKKEARPTGQQL